MKECKFCIISARYKVMIVKDILTYTYIYPNILTSYVVTPIPDCSIGVSGVRDPIYGCVDVCPPEKEQENFCTHGMLNNSNFKTDISVRMVHRSRN